jgi:hypothetical protein
MPRRSLVRGEAREQQGKSWKGKYLGQRQRMQERERREADPRQLAAGQLFAGAWLHHLNFRGKKKKNFRGEVNV